ncbi:MAG: hypothetical protein H7836_11380 [Magnetococcus sp. YQC-3]
MSQYPFWLKNQADYNAGKCSEWEHKYNILMDEYQKLLIEFKKLFKENIDLKKGK